MIVSATPTCCDEIGVPWESWLQRLCIWLAAGDCYVDIITPWSGYYSYTCQPFSLGLWDNIITNITARGCFSSHRPSLYCVLLFTFGDSKKTVSQTVNLIAGKLELMRTSNAEFTTNTNLKKHPFNTNKWSLSVRARPPQTFWPQSPYLSFICGW